MPGGFWGECAEEEKETAERRPGEEKRRFPGPAGVGKGRLPPCSVDVPSSARGSGGQYSGPGGQLGGLGGPFGRRRGPFERRGGPARCPGGRLGVLDAHSGARGSVWAPWRPVFGVLEAPFGGSVEASLEQPEVRARPGGPCVFDMHHRACGPSNYRPSRLAVVARCENLRF